MAAMAVIRMPRPVPSLLGPVAATSTPLRRHRRRGQRAVRLSVSCRAGGDGEQGGEKEEEDSPESLFARELQRRGMAPGAAPSAAGEKQAEEGGAEAGTKRRATAAAEFERRAAAGGGADGQRERSMALNSEGLEGLVPRAKLLLSLGGTFFLAFWPLILVTVALFAGLYLYFGPSFVHDASKAPISPPPYIDPYELLEDERITRPSPDVF